MFEILSLSTTVIVGLFAGSLLTEATILVPYWRKMSHREFTQLHSSLGPNLFRYFAPLTTLAVASSAITAAIAGTNNIGWLLSATLCALTLGIFFAYFKAANHRFASGELHEQELIDELKAWSNWHWIRTIIAVCALAASIYGHQIAQ